MRLSQETTDFFRQIRLRGVELPATGELEVILRGGDVRSRVGLRRFQVFGSKLRRNLRRRWFRRGRVCSF